MLDRMHTLCQAARTGTKSITDFETFKTWRKRYWKPIMRLHTTTFGPMKDPARLPKPVVVPDTELPDDWYYYYYETGGEWRSPGGYTYEGTRDGLKGIEHG